MLTVGKEMRAGPFRLLDRGGGDKRRWHTIDVYRSCAAADVYIP